MNIIITGASKGIGKAIAEQFAVEGNTLLVCARNEMHLYKMMEELLLKYPQCNIKAKPADISVKPTAIEFAEWCAGFGTPDVLINNAGLFFAGNIYNEADGVLEKTMEVNLYSAYYVTRTVLPAMMKVKAGHIFNLCSIASLQAYENGGSYSISKFALLGFSKNLREEMKPFNIKVTSVIPGAVYTDSWSGSNVDEKRIMEAADVAKMIYTASLLSPQACVEEIIMRPVLGDL